MAPRVHQNKLGVINVELTIKVTDKPPVKVVCLCVILKRIEFVFYLNIYIVAVTGGFAALCFNNPVCAVFFRNNVIGIEKS